MKVFGIAWVGLNAESGRKLLLSLIFIAIIVVSSTLLRTATGLVLRRTDHATLRAKFWSRQVVNMLSAALLILGVMSIWFSDPTRLATVFGLISAGLAFALQQVITSIAGYFVILRGSTFNVGDRISMGGVRGDVLRLGFIQTTIMEMGQPPSMPGADPDMWVKSRQFTGRIVTVTNSKIFAEPVYNYTRDFPYIWEEMPIPITYAADRARVEAVLLEAARLHAVDPDSIAAEGQGAHAGQVRRRADRPRATSLFPDHRQLAGTHRAVPAGDAPDPQRQGRHEPAHHRRTGQGGDRHRLLDLRHRRLPAARDAVSGRRRASPAGAGLLNALLDHLKTATLWLASGTEAAAALIISLAVVEGVARALVLFVPRPGLGGASDASQDAKEVVRLKLGRWLALALEFELAADILRTAVAPTWSEIGQLAAIAALRTALNFFLQREIDSAEQRENSGLH